MNAQELIDAAERQAEYTAEWAERIESQAESYTPNATGDLALLHVSVDPHYPEFLTFQSRSGVAPHFLELAAFGLRDYVSAATVERLPQVIRAARIEYARAEFMAALFASLICREIRPDRQSEFANYSKRWKARGWNDADVIAANPIALFDSPARNFEDWLSRVQRGEGERPKHLARDPCATLDPIISTTVISAGIVAVWMDAALQHPKEANTLLAHAMELFGFVRWMHGWEAAREDAKIVRSNSAKAAANALHARHREERQRAIDAYRTGRYGSNKDAAAFAIAGKVVPLSFSTVRDALKTPKESD